MITSYCIIRNQTIVCDGKILYAEKAADLTTFLFNAYTFLQIDYPKFHKMDNLSKLGFLAAEVILRKRELMKEYAAENVSLVLSNAHASLDTDIRYAVSAKTVGSPALFVYTLPNIVAGEICIRHKIKGENAFFISEAFDAELLTNYGNMVLTNSPGQIPTSCVLGWVDVLSGHHDVFLYLTEKNKPGSWKHTAEQVDELYNTSLWNN